VLPFLFRLLRIRIAISCPRFLLRHLLDKTTSYSFFGFAIFIVHLTCTQSYAGALSERPNILVIFTDDQGYGDLSCFGSTTIRTPRLDSLANDGTKFTNFYAQVVCGPSRSALLTGRYPHRSLGWSMPASEVTIAELLREVGYETGCIGKWDVSNRSAIIDRMPNAQGFNCFFGTLGANDNGKVVIHKNNERIEETNDMASLTRTYTDQGIEFIRENKDRPFFLYLAHTMAHSVIDASPEFRGKSRGGLFGDTIEELDFHSGRLLDAIDEMGLRDNTLVIFTTDNGAWNNMQENLRKRHDGEIAWGSSGPLREGKGSTYEGGIRVPCLARWPGKIPAGRTSDAIFATIDFLPTFAKLASAAIPTNFYIDGIDQSELLFGTSPRGNRDDFFYFCKNELHAVRKGNYKLVLSDRRQHYAYVQDKGSNRFELYDLAKDLGEKHDLAQEKPDLVQELKRYATSIPHPDTVPDDRIVMGKVTKSNSEADGRNLILSNWEDHGFREEGRREIRKIFQEGIDGKVIPGGSLMILHRGEVVLREAMGVADLETKRPFAVDSPCRIASLTKPHTATLLILLEEKGFLKLDDPVDLYLPEFHGLRIRDKGKSTRAPSIRECLSHTAGFSGSKERRVNWDSSINLLTLGATVTELAKQELNTAPGTNYDYSGDGYLVAGRIAEVVMGRSFQDLMRRYLLEPLGTQSATFVPSEHMRPMIPVQYDRTNRGLIPRIREQSPRSISPGGGMVSTLDDIARFLLLHRNEGKVGQLEIVSKAALQKQYEAHPASKGTGYGLGFNILATRGDGTASRVQHTGASGTLGLIDFDRDLIVIVLTQVDQSKIGGWRSKLLKTIAEVCRVK
jgi:arylsulfatase A-like enzyme/CubicO group peptidase (beta-lactamase class C family)